MSRIRKTRLHAWLLLAALLFSTTLPRSFVVCVSDDDHVSLEAVFEGDPCETQFVFGARADAAVPSPVATCTDIPAVQLSALSGDERTIVASHANEPALRPGARLGGDVDLDAAFDTALHRVATAVPPDRLERRALRTTLLRL